MELSLQKEITEARWRIKGGDSDGSGQRYMGAWMQELTSLASISSLNTEKRTHRHLCAGKYTVVTRYFSSSTILKPGVWGLLSWSPPDNYLYFAMHQTFQASVCGDISELARANTDRVSLSHGLHATPTRSMSVPMASYTHQQYLV